MVEGYTKVVYRDGKGIRTLKCQILEEDDVFISVLSGNLKIRLNKNVVERVENWQGDAQ